MSINHGHAICISLNDRFVWYGHLMLKSLGRNWPDHPTVLVQYSELSPASLQALKRFPKVKLCPERDSIQGPPINLVAGADTKAPYLRLNLWSNRFDNYDNILYLDSDMIVLKSLADLLHRKEFVIFRDPVTTTAGMFMDGTLPSLQELISTDKYELGGDMANSGVFVLPRKLRNQQRFAELMEILERYREHVRFSDQTIINLWMMKNGLKPLRDPSYNYLVKQPPAVLEQTGIDNIRVLHFAGFAEQSPRRKLLMQLASYLCRSSAGKRLYAVIQTSLLKHGPQVTCLPAK